MPRITRTARTSRPGIKSRELSMERRATHNFVQRVRTFIYECADENPKIQADREIYTLEGSDIYNRWPDIWRERTHRPFEFLPLIPFLTEIVHSRSLVRNMNPALIECMRREVESDQRRVSKAIEMIDREQSRRERQRTPPPFIMGNEIYKGSDMKNKEHFWSSIYKFVDNCSHENPRLSVLIYMSRLLKLDWETYENPSDFIRAIADGRYPEVPYLVPCARQQTM